MKMSLSIAIISTLFFSACAGQASHNSDEGTLKKAEQIQKLPIFFRSDFNNCVNSSRKDSEDAKIICSGELNEFTERLIIIGPAKSELFLAQAYKSEGSGHVDPRNIFFFLTGGPLYSYPRTYRMLSAYEHLDRRDLIVYPVFHGTSHRTSGDSVADSKLALREIQDSYDALKRRYPKSRIVVIGESWGSYYASRLELRDKEPVVLISPPIGYSGNGFDNFFIENFPKNGRDADYTIASLEVDSKVPIRINRYEYISSFLKYLGNEQFVSPNFFESRSCRMVIVGNNDPMLQDFLSNEKNKAIVQNLVRIDSGHDVIGKFHNLFDFLGESRC
jgi:pimeloyl-ACP methyl ester carboxylesterase